MSKFKYTGQEEDKESGLMYYKARYYDPALGRFLQADSVVSDSLFGYNRYMYVEGNPVKFRDPSGHSKIGDFFSRIYEGVKGGGERIAKDMKGGADWTAKSMKGGTDVLKYANHGFKAAKNTYDNVVFKATATRYQRSDWAKGQRRIFGNYQGDVNNEFWNNALYENKIDPGNAIAAWGGSYVMIAGLISVAGIVGGLIRNAALYANNYYVSNIAPALAPYAGLNQWLNLARAGYVWGGTKGFSRGMKYWDEQDARNGAVRGACWGTMIGATYAGGVAGSPIASEAPAGSFLKGLSWTMSRKDALLLLGIDVLGFAVGCDDLNWWDK